MHPLEWLFLLSVFLFADYKYFFVYIQGNSSWSSHGMVTSPGFPLPHKVSSAYIYFYELENLNLDGRIKVVFGDFFLDSVNKSVNICNEEQNYLKVSHFRLIDT